MPSPIKAIAIDGVVAALLAIVSCPFSAPELLGPKLTGSVNVWPGCKVSGSEGVFAEKPLPAAVRALIWSGAVPLEVNVRLCCAFPPIGTAKSH